MKNEYKRTRYLILALAVGILATGGYFIYKAINLF